MILGSIEILAEAFTLGERTGIDSQLVQNLVRELLPAPMYALLSTLSRASALTRYQYRELRREDST